MTIHGEGLRNLPEVAVLLDEVEWVQKGTMSFEGVNKPTVCMKVNLIVTRGDENFNQPTVMCMAPDMYELLVNKANYPSYSEL